MVHVPIPGIPSPDTKRGLVVRCR